MGCGCRCEYRGCHCHIHHIHAYMRTRDHYNMHANKQTFKHATTCGNMQTCKHANMHACSRRGTLHIRGANQSINQSIKRSTAPSYEKGSFYCGEKAPARQCGARTHCFKKRVLFCLLFNAPARQCGPRTPSPSTQLWVMV